MGETDDQSGHDPAGEHAHGVLTLLERHLLTRLPAACALALALRECGLSSTEISWWLGLPAASMPTLFEVSAARLAALVPAATPEANVEDEV